MAYTARIMQQENESKGWMKIVPLYPVSCKAPRVSPEVKVHPAANPPSSPDIAVQTLKRVPRCGVREPIWFWLYPHNPGFLSASPTAGLQVPGW